MPTLKINNLYFLITQDDNRTPVSQSVSSKTEEPSSVTPPENWGGERVSDKFARPRQQLPHPSRFATLASSSSISSGSMMTGLQDPSLPSSQTGINYRVRDSQESPLAYSDIPPFGSTSLSLGVKGNIESSGLVLTQTRRPSSYAERISTNSSFSDGTLGSPKTKKTGAETREELLNSFSPRYERSSATEPAIPSSTNVR